MSVYDNLLERENDIMMVWRKKRTRKRNSRDAVILFGTRRWKIEEAIRMIATLGWTG